ncbi:hypothetical protein ACKKBF_B36230 [Auxenochlorella protothecoides x Auxenochlorella symbiontica]
MPETPAHPATQTHGYSMLSASNMPLGRPFVAASRSWPGPRRLAISRHARRVGLERLRPPSPLREPARFCPRANSSSTPSPGGYGGPGSRWVTTTPPEPPPKPPTEVPAASTPFELRPYHYATFLCLLVGGLLFLTVLLYATSDGLGFRGATVKVIKRFLKTVALRQVLGILGAMTFVQYGLSPLLKSLRGAMDAQGPWEKSAEHYILRELHKPLNFLFIVAAFATLAENFLPQLIAIPKSVLQTMVRSTLSLTLVLSIARVALNIKARGMREALWLLELKAETTRQRRMEAIDKLVSLLIYVVAAVFSLQALGLDVNSVLAIGGVGGLAVGLAGREILENLFTGLIILSSNPFEVGEEVLFRPTSGQVVEGIVVDVGWYRTTIRSFEREIYTIPNSVFSRTVVLNVTRKVKEWRFYEFLGIRVEDTRRVEAVVNDMRKILRQDTRVIQRLHRRVFLDKITRDQATIYTSFYVEALNRDSFMAIKQDLLLAFRDCVERNGATMALNRLQLEMLPGGSGSGNELAALSLQAPTAPTVDATRLPALADGTSDGSGDDDESETYLDAREPCREGESGEGGEGEDAAASSNIVPAASGGVAGPGPAPHDAPSGPAPPAQSQPRVMAAAVGSASASLSATAAVFTQPGVQRRISGGLADAGDAAAQAPGGV